MTYISPETASQRAAAGLSSAAPVRAATPKSVEEIPPHAAPAADVIARLGTNRADGLTAAAVSTAQSRYGPNELPTAQPGPWWRRLGGQFKDLMIWVLLAAAVISGVAGETIDAGVILAIVVLNGLLGFLQEERAGRALAALQEMAAPRAKVIRDGRLQVVPARDLVPGDRVELEAGDHVPADIRLVDAAGLRVQEATLTGESAPVDKQADAILPAGTSLAERRNLAHMGTIVTAGTAGGIVVGTGPATELGRIAGLLGRHQPEPTPLQRRLAGLGRTLIVVCLSLVAIVFALELLRGGRVLDVFLTAVSLAVAALPEGLPAVVTIALALGLQRMARRNALVRRLPSVETLGSVTVICSDKTGTLTRNEMTVREVYAGGRPFAVTGGGYTPHGQFLRGAAPKADAADGQRVDAASEPDLLQAMTVAAWCSHARVSRRDGREDGGWEVVGDPTEGALVVAAMKAGIEAANRPHCLLYEIPFDSDRKMMSVVAAPDAPASDGAQGTAVMYTKGAPEVVLARCKAELRDGTVRPLTDARRQEIRSGAARMATRALRVLGLAFREWPDPAPEAYEEADLVFAGLAGMMDPPRDEARAAVGTCHRAGIRPVMITGDHPDTALAIARDLRIAGVGDEAVSGTRLDQLSDDELAAGVERMPVFARVSAEHKLRIVRAWRARGQVVAMTGDGVNDAPAVEEADIGIAMGVTGTDVTKAAADMVLTDDNFASIVAAVEEGRGIFDNIRKFVHYLLASNASEILFMFVAAVAGWPLPLTATQILWINLVTDSLPALGLGVEPPEPGLMSRRPRRASEALIPWGAGALIVLHGAVMAAAAIGAFWIAYRGQAERVASARTVGFAVLAFSQLLYSLACRSRDITVRQLGVFSNRPLIMGVALLGALQIAVLTVPALGVPFRVVRLTAAGWLLIFVAALTPVSLIEIAKIVRRRLRRPAA